MICFDKGRYWTNRFCGAILNLLYGRFPRTVRIESTNHCNAKCITCPHPSQTREKGIMDTALYEGILKECVAEGARVLHLHNFGEPLIDKNLPERIRRAKESGIRKVKIITNGSLLDEKQSLALIDAGLDSIKVSFDGLSPAVFEKIRIGLCFDVVRNNLERLIRIRDEKGSKTPKVEILFVSTYENEVEEKDFIARWKGVVDKVYVTRAHNWGSRKYLSSSSVPRKPTGFPCLRLWQTFTVLWDGRVALCCLDYDGKEILGDLRECSLRDIWQGSRLKQIRRWHSRAEFAEVPICGSCNAR